VESAYIDEYSWYNQCESCCSSSLTCSNPPYAYVAITSPSSLWASESQSITSYSPQYNQVLITETEAALSGQTLEVKVYNNHDWAIDELLGDCSHYVDPYMLTSYSPVPFTCQYSDTARTVYLRFIKQ
jgi:hypothetical protein